MKDPWPEDRTVDIFRQICLGLSHVHARHIMHRDIKPANILLPGRRCQSPSTLLGLGCPLVFSQP